MFFFHENYKVDQFSEDFNLSLLGGSGQKSRLLVRLFDFAILAKFGDYEHNRHKKIVENKCFFHRKGGGGKILMDNFITFYAFFTETFLKYKCV